MKNLKFFIWMLWHPNYWVMMFKFDKVQDKFINDAIDKNFEIKPAWPYAAGTRKPHRIEINGESVWVANYPYAYGGLIDSKLRPSRRTIKRLYYYIKNHKQTNPEYYL